MTDADLVAAAQHERDRRAASYPEKIKDGADVEALTIDFQCWVAIAEWVETGHFFSFAGGADPDSPNAPIISWPHLQTAAQRALNKALNPSARRSALEAIHRKVALRRTSIDIINQHLRSTRGRELAA